MSPKTETVKKTLLLEMKVQELRERLPEFAQLMEFEDRLWEWVQNNSNRNSIARAVQAVQATIDAADSQNSKNSAKKHAAKRIISSLKYRDIAQFVKCAKKTAMS